jgi:hypothetical protein
MANSKSITKPATRKTIARTTTTRVAEPAAEQATVAEPKPKPSPYHATLHGLLGSVPRSNEDAPFDAWSSKPGEALLKALGIDSSTPMADTLDQLADDIEDLYELIYAANEHGYLAEQLTGEDQRMFARFRRLATKARAISALDVQVVAALR